MNCNTATPPTKPEEARAAALGDPGEAESNRNEHLREAALHGVVFARSNIDYDRALTAVSVISIVESTMNSETATPPTKLEEARAAALADAEEAESKRDEHLREAARHDAEAKRQRRIVDQLDQIISPAPGRANMVGADPAVRAASVPQAVLQLLREHADGMLARDIADAVPPIVGRDVPFAHVSSSLVTLVRTKKIARSGKYGSFMYRIRVGKAAAEEGGESKE